MRTWLRLFASSLTGAVFGLGLSLAHMTDPRKVQAFLDITGEWDPSLAFVMGAAVLTSFAGFRWMARRPAPLLDTHFHLPKATQVDRDLLIGATLFGMGWGLSGYCPGPAFANLFAGPTDAGWFIVAMLLGGWLQRR